MVRLGHLSSVSFVALLIVCSSAAFVKDCVPGLGLRTPPRVCTVSDPCTSLLRTYWMRGTFVISEPETPPLHCAATFNGKLYNDGSPRRIAITGKTEAASPSERSYCAYVPTSTDKVPLVIYFHGSGGTATGIYRDGWRHHAEQGIPTVFGGKPFAVVGVQALNRHWPPSGALGDGEDGTKFDFMFRNFTENDDIRYIDTIIDHMVSNDNIDPSRIFVSGYSNGCYFANMYASVRSGSTESGSWGTITGKTPNGNMVAAASSFSGSSPWQRPPECPYNLPPRTSVPLQVVIYGCDLIPCPLATDYKKILSLQGSKNASVVILADDETIVLDESTCVWEPAECSTAKRLLNHATYPHSQIPLMASFMDQNRGTGSTPPGTQGPLPTLTLPGGSPQSDPTTSPTATPSETATPSLAPTTNSTLSSAHVDVKPVLLSGLILLLLW